MNQFCSESAHFGLFIDTASSLVVVFFFILSRWLTNLEVCESSKLPENTYLCQSVCDDTC